MGKQNSRTLQKLWNQSNRNSNNVSNLESIKTKIQTSTELKKQKRINLATKQLFEGSSTTLNYTFEKFPEWMFQFIKVHTVFYTTEGFEINEYLFYNSQTNWEQSGEKLVLTYKLAAYLKIPTELGLIQDAPLYYTTDLIIINKLIWNQISVKNK